jgi:hypothetical protein
MRLTGHQSEKQNPRRWWPTGVGHVDGKRRVNFHTGGFPKTMPGHGSSRKGNDQAGLRAGVNQSFHPNLLPKSVTNGNRRSMRPINWREPQPSSLHFFTKLFGLLPCCLANEAKPTIQTLVGFHLTPNAFIKT